MLATALLAFSFVTFLKGLILFFFVLGAILLTIVILLQEPKGGGLSSAFGGAGAETFGVQAGGVNRFTAWVAGIYIVLAILYAAIRPEGAISASDQLSQPQRGIAAPADGADPAAPGGADPAAPDGADPAAPGGAETGDTGEPEGGG